VDRLERARRTRIVLWLPVLAAENRTVHVAF
jgi:hypothetical protein